MNGGSRIEAGQLGPDQAGGAIPPLRLVPPPTPEELARRLEREQRVRTLERESLLESSLAPFRVGVFPFLNAAPLIRGIEGEVQFAPPAELARRLLLGELDAALVSVTEVLFHDAYDVLDGIALASLGEVLSVFLAHREPLEQVRDVYCDPGSLTSVALLRVLLAERGQSVEIHPLADTAPDRWPDNILLIGNRAIDYRRTSTSRTLWDLGAAWYELTQLPFVYAVWALRRDCPTAPLRRRLREARDFGLKTLDAIIRERPEYDYNFRKDYLSWHIHYHLGTDEKRGLARFGEYLRRHGPGPVFDPRFVE